MDGYIIIQLFINKIYFIIDQQIARHLCLLVKVFTTSLPFCATQKLHLFKLQETSRSEPIKIKECGFSQSCNLNTLILVLVYDFFCINTSRHPHYNAILCYIIVIKNIYLLSYPQLKKTIIYYTTVVHLKRVYLNLKKKLLYFDIKMFLLKGVQGIRKGKMSVSKKINKVRCLI